MTFDISKMATFGVAGNFAGHLEQAGEAIDFINVKTQEENAPKALFPTYIPNITLCKTVPSFLGVYPFDSDKIVYPKGEMKVQMESECALICNITWDNDQISSIIPVAFGASNDCSIRKEGAKKISIKKNWGSSSKGLSPTLLPLEDFTSKGDINNYRIASYLMREGTLIEYGENSKVSTYSYMYEKLLSWCLDKLNNQGDTGPQEIIHNYLVECGKPTTIMISIGATRYTDFGKTNFLQNGDESIIVLYNEKTYNIEEIESILKKGDTRDDISILRQKVIL